MKTWKINLVGFVVAALTFILIALGTNFESIQNAEMSRPWLILMCLVLGVGVSAMSTVFIVISGNKVSNYVLFPAGCMLVCLMALLANPLADHSQAAVISALMFGLASGLAGSLTAKFLENRSKTV